MSSKDEIQAAKEAAANLQAEGATLAQAAETLNLAYSGLYYVVGGHIYRENDLDCYPATRII